VASGPDDKDVLIDELVGHLPRLRGFCISLTGSVSDGDDLVQSAYEKALGSIHQFDKTVNNGGGHSAAWLFKIARNHFLNDRRYQATRNRYLELVTPAEENASDGVFLSELRHETRRTLQAMNGLPEEQRTVLLLVAAEGFSYREAADILDLPSGTVMSRLSRARAALRDILGSSGPDADGGNANSAQNVR
jgi:RNA polymerase sigma-70 factor (ECF subfamily)